MANRRNAPIRVICAGSAASADRGPQATCESVLGAARDGYTTYVAGLRNGQVPIADVSTWRRQQIESAIPVAGNGMACQEVDQYWAAYTAVASN